MWRMWQIEMLVVCWQRGLPMDCIEQEFGMTRQQVGGMVKRLALIGRVSEIRLGGYTGSWRKAA